MRSSAAVLGAADIGGVRGDGVGGAKAGRGDARRVDAVALQIIGDRIGALLRQPHVDRVAADRIGEAVDVDIGRLILRQRLRDLVERRHEFRVEFGRVEIEGDGGRHFKLDDVALALDFDAGAGGLGAQCAFLLVHVAARGAAGEHADRAADEGTRAAAADQPAQQRTARGTGNRALAAAGHRLLAGDRVGDAAGSAEQQAGAGGGHDGLLENRHRLDFLN